MEIDFVPHCTTTIQFSHPGTSWWVTPEKLPAFYYLLYNIVVLALHNKHANKIMERMGAKLAMGPMW